MSAGGFTGGPIDLRSDTVTRPDAEMRRAMAEAEVGDDLFGEDPTVRRLEEAAAEAMGTEAALFTPSGTMANQISLHLHARPGEELVCEASCHHVLFEMGAMAALSGLLPRPVAGERGLLSAAEVEAAIAPEAIYRSRTGAISVENTAMMAGGTVYGPEASDRLVAVARRRRLPIHLDGARIFNAAVRLGVPARRLARGYDSVMFSLSKGLGGPSGSMLCGARGWIGEARRVRKMFGGGMRQVGVLAAAGLLALEKGPARLADDHANAGRLARGLAAIDGIAIDPDRVETNIVIAELEAAEAPAVADRLAADGVLTVALDPRRLRFVTHRDVSAEAIEIALERIAKAVPPKP